MKQVWIQRKGKSHLRLFFAGWGMDENLCRHFSSNRHDLMLCYDYRDIQFDPVHLSTYTHIEVTGWSLGVWAASIVLKRELFTPQIAIAFNGTTTPIHDTKGILTAIYNGTLNLLSPASLLKFNRRMCGSASECSYFEQYASSRSIEVLKEELACIRYEYENQAPIHHQSLWNEAWIGEKDLIFPVCNQQNAWKGNVPVRLLPDVAHYNHTIIRLLQCGNLYEL